MITSNELFMLMLVWYAPPSVLSVALQIYFYKKQKSINCNKAFIISITSMSIILPFFMGYFLLPVEMPRWLGASHSMLFLPLAWLLVLILGFVAVLALKIYRCKIA